MSMTGVRAVLRRVWLETRLFVATALHRCVPLALVPAVVELRSSIGRRRPGRWATAQESMRFVVGESAPEAEIDRLADAYLKRTSWRAEVRWRPKLVRNQPVEGLEHVRDALQLGRGCLVSYTHHGDFAGAFSSMARAGQPVTVLAASYFYDTAAPLWMVRHLRNGTSVEGVTVVDVAGGSRVVREALAQGSVVAIAIDFPGNTPVRFLGHDLHISSGGTWIAVDMDVPVVTMDSRPHPTRTYGGSTVVLSPALHPRDFESTADLQAHLMRHFEKTILAWPEAWRSPCG